MRTRRRSATSRRIASPVVQAVLVIQVGEAVDVEEHDGDRVRVAARLGSFGPQPVQRRPAAGQRR